VGLVIFAKSDIQEDPMNYRISRKKSLGIIVLFSCLTLLMFFFIACEANQERTGSIHLQLSSSARYQSRNIGPLGTDPLNIATYSISGSGPNGKTLAAVTTNHAVLTISGLSIGNWTLYATAYNSVGKALVKGEVSLYVAPSTNAIDLEMDEAVGSGTLQVSYLWNPNQTTENSVFIITIEDSLANITPITLQNPDIASGDASFSTTLPAGFYTLRTILKTGNDVISGNTETVRIIEGTESRGIIEMVIGGEVDEFTLTVIDNTLSPITGSIAVSPTTPTKGGSATLTYTPVLPVGILMSEISVQWYFEGQIINGATANSLVINPVLSGTHRYDVVLKHTRQGSIGSKGVSLSVPSVVTVVSPMGN